MSAESGDEAPLVSVVIPTYGRNERLSEAVESVADQEYEPIELLVVDDGSPTPVTETLTDLPSEQLESITFIRHAENKGANAARNSGIRAAVGEYIAFLDDDDQWHESKIGRQVAAFQSTDPEVGVVYTGRRAENPRGTAVMTPTAEGNVLPNLLAGESLGEFSCLMVRADVIDDAGFLDERFPAWQDREWYFRLAQHTRFKPIPEILTVRRTGLPDSITKQFEKKRDVAYPLFIEKYYPLAREQGFYQARQFLASMRMILARAAIRAGEYGEGRKYFLLALVANPLYRPLYPHLLASLGGKWTYESAAVLRRKYRAVRSFFDSL